MESANRLYCVEKTRSNEKCTTAHAMQRKASPKLIIEIEYFRF